MFLFCLHFAFTRIQRKIVTVLRKLTRGKKSFCVPRQQIQIRGRHQPKAKFSQKLSTLTIGLETKTDYFLFPRASKNDLRALENGCFTSKLVDILKTDLTFQLIIPFNLSLKSIKLYNNFLHSNYLNTLEICRLPSTSHLKMPWVPNNYQKPG